MKNIALLIGIVLVGILALQSSDKYKKRVNYVPNNGWDDDVWFG
ncbi:MAG TPA: hypothetical protein VGP43_09140 [Chitinophagaceae bacterium]|nr:hypothetical protein [Chitinophagaceae bacterium]